MGLMFELIDVSEAYKDLNIHSCLFSVFWLPREQKPCQTRGF